MNSLTTVFLTDYDVQMSIGIYPEEKQNKQRVVVSIQADCFLDVQNDAIEETVSYERFIQCIDQFAAERHYNLIEVFVEDVAQALLADKRIHSVEVRGEKPDIFGGNPKSAGVRIVRRQDG